MDEALIPALDMVGSGYEKGILFLPQLLQAASAAQSAFEQIKAAIAAKGQTGGSKGRILLATVKADARMARTLAPYEASGPAAQQQGADGEKDGLVQDVDDKGVPADE